MAGQLIPPPGFEPQVPEDATPEQCIRMWLDLLDACEQFLLAGLRREIGPDGDLEAAYCQWNRQQREEHDEKIQRMARIRQPHGGDDGR